MNHPLSRPRVVLLCHEDDPIDTRGLSAWLATETDLVGTVAIRSPWQRRARVARRELRRSGWLGALDGALFRAYYQLALARRDRAWLAAEVRRLETAYPGQQTDVPRLLTASPNTDAVRRFLLARSPDIVIARCKVLLDPAIFTIARAGTFALHPGICPEYRNAHGCFWALVRRDLGRVGMTMLRIDRGVDTGPVYLRATCRFDEQRESHVVIQCRAVTDNLDAIASVLRDVHDGSATPVSDPPRTSAVWGQPRLSAYCKWKWAARRDYRDARRLSASS